MYILNNMADYKVCKDHMSTYVTWLNSNKDVSAQLHPGQRIAIKVLIKFWNEFNESSYDSLLAIESYHQMLHVNSRNTDLWSKYIISVEKLTLKYMEVEMKKEHAECGGECNHEEEGEDVCGHECGDACVPGSCDHENIFQRLREEYMAAYKKEFNINSEEDIKKEYTAKEAIVDIAKNYLFWCGRKPFVSFDTTKDDPETVMRHKICTHGMKEATSAAARYDILKEVLDLIEAVNTECAKRDAEEATEVPVVTDKKPVE